MIPQSHTFIKTSAVVKVGRVLTLWFLAVLLTGLWLGKNIFVVSDIDRIAFNSSNGYVENRIMAKLGYNKFSFYTNRYLSNFFAGFDPNYFFFGGHPREVPGGNNEMKISYWLLPFFLLGAYEQLERREKRIIIPYVLTLLIVSFFSIDALWWSLVSFWYLTVLYPIRDIFHLGGATSGVTIRGVKL